MITSSPGLTSRYRGSSSKACLPLIVAGKRKRRVTNMFNLFTLGTREEKTVLSDCLLHLGLLISIMIESTLLQARIFYWNLTTQELTHYFCLISSWWNEICFLFRTHTHTHTHTHTLKRCFILSRGGTSDTGNEDCKQQQQRRREKKKRRCHFVMFSGSLSLPLLNWNCYLPSVSATDDTLPSCLFPPSSSSH